MVRYAVLLALVACEPMPNPSDDLMAPVQESSPEPQMTVAGDTPAQAAEMFDFEGILHLNNGYP